MPLFLWDQTCSVNIPEIDRQHQYLFALINHLHEAMLFGHGRLLVAGVLKELAAYAGSHFASEEAYMRGTAYHGLALHQAEHAFYLQKLRTFTEQFDNGTTELTVEIMSFLENWIRRHVQHSDKEFGSTVPLPPLSRN